MSSNFQMFWPKLRELGFKKEWASRHQDGDARQYIRYEKDRALVVRINEHAPHSVTHRIMHPTDAARQRWKETTYPLEFNTIPEMEEALAHEATRPHNYDDPSEVVPWK